MCHQEHTGSFTNISYSVAVEGRGIGGGRGGRGGFGGRAKQGAKKAGEHAPDAAGVAGTAIGFIPAPGK